MADLKTSRKGKPKNEDDFIDDEEEDTDDEEVEERHCICDSRYFNFIYSDLIMGYTLWLKKSIL